MKVGVSVPEFRIQGSGNEVCVSDFGVFVSGLRVEG